MTILTFFLFSAADLVLYAALLPPHIAEPRGQLIWNDGNWIDMDSPTTPETDTEINEYDIVEDLRHYLNYTTSSRFPNIQKVMDELLAKEKKSTQEATPEETTHAHAHKKYPSTVQEKEERNLTRDATGGETKHAHAHNKHTSKRVSNARGNKSARAARAVSDSSSPVVRTITRCTLPEDWLSSYQYWDMTYRHLISTLPPPRA